MRQAAQDAILAEKIVVIVGPTASGKTELALALARALGGEIVSADSRQVYRELNAGTAKPARDRAGRVEGIPYHLTDCAGLADPFDAGRFAALARTEVAAIHQRGATAVVAGGTGLYVRALLEGLCALPTRDETLRRKLEEEARAGGRARLHERLARVDPQAAARIPANNIQRVVRALEVFELTGRPISELWQDNKPLGGQLSASVAFRIDWPPDILRRRIRERAEGMWPAMLEEVAGLLGRFSGSEPCFASLGYPEAVACVRGQLEPEEGLQRLINSTCAYAKRQRTWFRHQVSAVPVTGGRIEDMLSTCLAHCGCREPAGAGRTDFIATGASLPKP